MYIHTVRYVQMVSRSGDYFYIESFGPLQKLAVQYVPAALFHLSALFSDLI